MISQQPDLAIVIVNWNTRDLLLDCLAALPAATAGLAVETWVVDNASSDGSVAAVRAGFPAVQVIVNDGNYGFAHANNQAIQASTGRHVLLLNSDTIARPASLTSLVHVLDAYPRIGIAGAHLLNADGTLQPSWAAFPTIWSELFGLNVRIRRPFGANAEVFAVDWVGGACLMIRRATIAQIGLMDERYFMYSEETDWCYRAYRAGWQVCYHNGAEVVHLGGQSSKQASTRMKAQLYRSKLLFFHKHYGAQVAGMLEVLLQAGFLTRALISGLARHRGNESEQIARRLDATVMLRALSGR